MRREPDNRELLLRDGYVVVPDVVRAEQLDAMRDLALRCFADVSDEERAARRSPGSLISLWHDPGFAPLVLSTRIHEALRQCGFSNPLFSNGYVVSKPPQSPPTFWHQDWWGWRDAASYSAFVHQVGVLFYLVDTDETNGCLRVVPGSHRARHPLHVPTPLERTWALRRYEDPAAPEFQAAAGEKSVALRAGDVALIDARLLHATHANTTSKDRPAVLLWFIADYGAWSASLKERLPNVVTPQAWPQEVQTALNAMLPPQAGTDAPRPDDFGLYPDERLTAAR